MALRAFLNQLLAQAYDGMPREDYNARVGTVGKPPPASASDHYAALCMLNRKFHHDRLCRRIEQLAKQPAVPPLVVVVPFRDNDMRSLFIERFGNYELERRTGRSCRFLSHLPWPAGQELEELVQELKQEIGISDEDEAWPESLQEGLCFSLTLSDRDWDEDGAAKNLATAWVDHVVEKWPPCSTGHFVLTFLCIEANDSSGRPQYEQRRIEQRIVFMNELCRKRVEHERFLALASFPSVMRVDVDEWLGFLKREGASPRLIAGLRKTANELFETGEKHVMAEIHDALYERFEQLATHPVQP